MNDEMMAFEKAQGDKTIVELPISTLCQIAKADPANLLKLGEEWSIVHWEAEDESLPVSSRRLTVKSFADREEASKFLASMYERQPDIEAILNCGRPKRFEIEVKAKIVLR